MVAERNIRSVVGNNIDKEDIRNMTLCFIQKDKRVLLGRKTRKIGKGMWNGLGGNVEKDDKSIKDAAKREVLEESGLEVDDLEYCGIIDFKFPETNRVNKVHLFTTNNFKGEPTITEEMSEFFWFESSNLPFDEMLEADGHFIPEILRGRKIKAEFNYDLEFNLISYEIDDLNETHESELIEPSHQGLKIR